MHPSKVDRNRLHDLSDLPNIGSAMAEDLRLLGIEHPTALKGMDPWKMYARLCELTGARQDPCVIDVFISITRFMDGQPPRPWWDFTAERKRVLLEKPELFSMYSAGLAQSDNPRGRNRRGSFDCQAESEVLKSCEKP